MSTWWIQEPFVLGSSNPSDHQLAQLRAQGFTVLVSFLNDNAQRPRYDVHAVGQAGWSRYSIAVEDFHAPSLEQLRNFNALLETVPENTKVVVHCEGGSGRTGTMGAAYWIARGLTATQAIGRVRKAKPEAIENCEQEKVLYQYAELLEGILKNKPSA